MAILNEKETFSSEKRGQMAVGERSSNGIVSNFLHQGGERGTGLRVSQLRVTAAPRRGPNELLIQSKTLLGDGGGATVPRNAITSSPIIDIVPDGRVFVGLMLANVRACPNSPQ